MEAFTYKGISAGKYVEGEIEALNQDEASFKLKEQKVIITNLVKSAKKKGETKEKTKKKGLNFFSRNFRVRRNVYAFPILIKSDSNGMSSINLLSPGTNVP